jgi:hypothetical protein
LAAADKGSEMTNGIFPRVSSFPHFRPDQAHGMVQEQVARVNAQRPLQSPIAHEHKARLRVVLEDGRHGSHQDVRPVPFIQLATLFFAYPVVYSAMISMMESGIRIETEEE